MGCRQAPGVIGDLLAVARQRDILEQERTAPAAVVHDEDEFPQRHVVRDVAVGGRAGVPGFLDRQVVVERGDLVGESGLVAEDAVLLAPGFIRVLKQAGRGRAGIVLPRPVAERRFDVGNVRRDLDGRGGTISTPATRHRSWEGLAHGTLM